MWMNMRDEIEASRRVTVLARSSWNGGWDDVCANDAALTGYAISWSGRALPGVALGRVSEHRRWTLEGGEA